MTWKKKQKTNGEEEKEKKSNLRARRKSPEGGKNVIADKSKHQKSNSTHAVRDRTNTIQHDAVTNSGPRGHLTWLGVLMGCRPVLE